MAVSAPQVRIFVNGKRNAMHDALVPEVFRLVDQVKRDSSLLKPVTGAENGVLGIQRKLRGGAKISVQKYGDWFICYIDVPGGEGFYTEVTEIYLTLSVFYDPVICFNAKTNKPVPCDSEHYCIGSTADPSKCFAKRIFRETKVYKDNGAVVVEDVPQTYMTASGVKYNGFDEADQIHINRLCSATTKTSAHGMGSDIHCYKAWSKTLDHVSAVAVLFYNRWVEVNMWCVLCDVGGKPYIFELGHIKSDFWPLSPYVDVFQVGGVDPYNTTPGYKGFDLWKEKKDINGEETKTYHYFLSMAADGNYQVDVWDLSATKPTKKWKAFGIGSISKFIKDNKLYYPYVNDGWEGRHIRFVGLNKRTYYWAVLDCHYGVASGQMQVEAGIGKVFWENDKKEGSIDFDTTDCGFQLAILDEYNEEVKCVDRISCQDCESSYGDIIYDPAYYAISVACFDWGCTQHISCDWTSGYLVGSYGPVCSLQYGNSTYDIYNFTGLAYCTNRPECEWTTVPNWGWVISGCGGVGEGGPSHLGDFSSIYNYFEVSDERTQCEQTGLEHGNSESRRGSGQNYTCWQEYLRAVNSPGHDCGGEWQCHCNYYCSACGRCKSGYWGNHVNGYCSRWTWDHWFVFGPWITEAAILPEGIRGSYKGIEKNGEAYACDSGNNDFTEETEYSADFPDGNAGEFAQAQWPYYPSYAIAKSTVSCTEPITTEEVVRKKQTGDAVKFSTYEMDEDELSSKCKIEMTNKNWSIVQDNTGKLHDTLGIIKNKYAQFFFIGQSTETRTYVTDN